MRCPWREKPRGYRNANHLTDADVLFFPASRRPTVRKLAIARDNKKNSRHSRVSNLGAKVMGGCDLLLEKNVYRYNNATRTFPHRRKSSEASSCTAR